MPKKYCEIVATVNGRNLHSVDWFEFGDQLHWRGQMYGSDKPILHPEEVAEALCVFLNYASGGTDDEGNKIEFTTREREPSEGKTKKCS